MKHLLSMTDLDQNSVYRLLDRAQALLTTVVKKDGLLPTLTGQVITNLFFEPSTRTQYSFAIAGQRLGALVLNPPIHFTSTVKGESVLDTVQSFLAMGTRLFVIRHGEEKIQARIAEQIHHQAAIINGGDGRHQHPTQALLDLFTIRQHKGEFAPLRVAIIGDIAHSRVAQSLIQALQIVGCNQIRLIAPPELLPANVRDWNVQTYTTLRDGLAEADVIVALRIQRERMETAAIPDPSQFFHQFGLTNDRLAFAKPDAIVLHPGPINRGIEIDSAVADGRQSVILQQITNGVAVRMAVIEWLLSA